MESADSLISNLDASEREEALSLLVKRIAQFPLTVQKVLAMYYYEGFHAAEIAMCLALTKDDVEQILAEMLGLLQTALSVWRDLKLSRIAPSRYSSTPTDGLLSASLPLPRLTLSQDIHEEVGEIRTSSLSPTFNSFTEGGS